MLHKTKSQEGQLLAFLLFFRVLAIGLALTLLTKSIFMFFDVFYRKVSTINIDTYLTITVRRIINVINLMI